MTDFLKPRYIPMNRRRRIYEGKAKVLYEGPEPGTLIQHFKDDATAFNAKKHEVIDGKGVLNNRISEYLFQNLNDIGVYRDQTVRLAELAALDDVLTGMTFENCEVVGPAVVVLLGDTKVSDCHWTGDVDAVLWPAHGREHVIGAIGLQDCVITGCQFFRVGIFVPDKQLPTVLAGFGLA